MSPDEAQLVDTLTRVPLLTVAQVARTWFAGAARETTRAIARLNGAAWLHVFPVKVHPELPLSAPVASWDPGTPVPRFGAVASMLSSRWSDVETQTQVVVASQRAEAVFGGKAGHLTQRDAINHDIHLATLYLRLLTSDPECTPRAWTPEWELPPARKGEILPDAVLRDDGGKVYHVVEFAGRYSAKRVAQIHRYCSARSLAYDLW